MATSIRAKATGCPICGKAIPPRAKATDLAASAAAVKPEPDPFPFCSARCQLVDLGRWLGGDYRIPDRETPVVHDADDPGRDEE